MPSEDQNQEVAPVETGFADLATEEAQHEPTPEELRTAAQAIVDQHTIEAQRLEAERDAIKAAAQAEERHSLHRQEEAETLIDTRSEAKKLNDQLHQRIIDARAAAREAEKPRPPQPVSPFIMEQTKREMEAGALQSKWHADQRAAAMANVSPARRAGLSPVPQPDSIVEVFRPNDYVPDQVKGQGYVKVTA